VAIVLGRLRNEDDEENYAMNGTVKGVGLEGKVSAVQAQALIYTTGGIRQYRINARPRGQIILRSKFYSKQTIFT